MQTDKPWHESAENVVALAKYMIAEDRPIANIGYLICEPKKYTALWQEYQATLKPQEPKLSEKFIGIGSQICNAMPDKELTRILLLQVRACEELAQQVESMKSRIEVLEENERVNND